LGIRLCKKGEYLVSERRTLQPNRERIKKIRCAMIRAHQFNKTIGGTIMDCRCPVCGSDEIVETGPLVISGSRAEVAVAVGRQCIFCGNLQVIIPQPVLVQLYPPSVQYLTDGKRHHLNGRRKKSHRA
ncbi:MAG: hypothetical protein OWS74_07835, partial [Firmicutes bacterium]|nr:hypothetical protein [Bacillota bacterium]